jgi:hypothetical protein
MPHALPLLQRLVEIGTHFIARRAKTLSAALTVEGRVLFEALALGVEDRLDGLDHGRLEMIEGKMRLTCLLRGSLADGRSRTYRRLQRIVAPPHDRLREVGLSMRRRLGVPFALFVLLLFVACTDEGPTVPRVSRSELVAALTPAAAALLDEAGHFSFEDPTPPAGTTWVSRGQARQLALAFWRTFQADVSRLAAQDRGLPIASNLSVCPRVHLAAAGYDPFPPELVRELRRGYGPMWLVGLCSGSEQQVAIAVSVESTDIPIDANGHVQGVLAGDFMIVGVRPGATVPIEPEYGAVFTATRARRLVAGVPRLTRNADRASPFTAIWTYDLDSPVTVVGANSGVDRTRAAFGLGRWSSPTDTRMMDSDPDAAGIPREETLSFFVNGTPATLVVTRRTDVPARWEPVTARTP